MKTLICFLLSAFSFQLFAQDPTLVNSNGEGITNPAFREAVLNGSNVDSTELGYLNNVSSNIQTQFSGKLTNSMATAKLLGRGTAGTGTIEEITLGANLSLSGTTLNATSSGGSFSSITGQPTDNTNLRAALNAKGDSARLAGLGRSMRLMQERADAPISAIFMGDSFAGLGGLFDFSLSSRIVGYYRAGAIAGGGDSGVTQDANTRWSIIASGGNLTGGYGTSSSQGPADTVYATLFPGTGTASIEWRNGAGSWTVVGATIDTTTIAAGTCRVIARTLPSGRLTSVGVRIVASGGTVNGYVGSGLTGPGITIMNMVGNSGTEIPNFYDFYTEAQWKAMFNGYRSTVSGDNVQVVLTGWADERFSVATSTSWPSAGTENWGASGPMQTLFDWSRTQFAQVDWFVFGPHLISTAQVNPVNATVDSLYAGIGITSGLLNDRIIDGAIAQREFALRNNIGFYDSTQLWTYAEGNAAGMYTDLIHLNQTGQLRKRTAALTNTNLGFLFGRNEKQTTVLLGNSRLVPVSTIGGEPGMAVMSAASFTANGAIYASALRAPLPGSIEITGAQIRSPSFNVVGIGVYSASSASDFFLVEAGSLSPVTNNSGNIGTLARNCHTVYTSGLNLGYAVKTADYVMPRSNNTDYLIHYKSGSFTVVLPLARDIEEPGAAGRCYIIKNSGAGTITVAAVSTNAIAATAMINGTTYVIESTGTTNFTSFGAASNAIGTSFTATGPGTGTGTLRNTMQKIDAATTVAVTAGNQLRVMSVQESGFASADHGNLITW